MIDNSAVETSLRQSGKRPTPPAPNDDLRAALEASLAKRSKPTMGDKVWSAAFNAALDMVARDTAAALKENRRG